METTSAPAAPAPSVAEIEAALLGILLSAETVREGADAILGSLEPVLDDASTAIALRDRDGRSLHILSERGPLERWPLSLEPQFAVGTRPGVDAATGVMVVPLRAHARVIGALLLADAPAAAVRLQDARVSLLLDAAAAVLLALTERNDLELQRRADALRAVDSVVDGMAHQIANPLTGASGIAQLLLPELPDDGQQAAVRQIRHELSRAFEVVRDILDFHRDTRAQDGTVDLNTVVERMVRLRGYHIREQGITLEFLSHAEFLPVHMDLRGLEHALLVALRFAELRSHGTVNRRIHVCVGQRDAGSLLVEITDSGTGDLPDLSPRYFDLPLNGGIRADRAHNASGEPDLGLVNSILRGCGGHLEARGSKTDGTTLTLVLPRAVANRASHPIRSHA